MKNLGVDYHSNKIRFWVIALICISFGSCHKKYIGTRHVCKNNLYLEIFEINPAGVDAAFLTDSINFRINIGKFDPESGNYDIACKEDSIYIKKIKYRNSYATDTTSEVVEKKILNIKALKSQHQLENN